MPQRIEITLKPELFDAEGEGIRRKAARYFGIEIEHIRTIQIMTIDAGLSENQVETVRKNIFTNPVTHISSLDPLPVPFDYTIWIGYRPGVRDNPGAVAVEAIEDFLGVRFGKGESVYTSRRYCITGTKLSLRDIEILANQLLANDIIQQTRIFSRDEWNPEVGVGWIIPKVILDHTPGVTTLPIESDDRLLEVSRERNLALDPNDIPVIRAYFSNPDVRAERSKAGLSDPTDVEIEYISQGRSDHCNHNTFHGKFYYRESPDSAVDIVDDLFETCIEQPTLEIKAKKPWVVSVLWDNAGVGRFDDDHYYVITGETHNSPSNMEAYGGAITGIVGVYRDPLGTGLGAKLIMGGYGYCVGPIDYDGDLRPRLHPRRLLDGVVEGVRDGGNKSGVPTTFGQVWFDPGYLGKCLVFVTAVGLMPKTVNGEPSELKTISDGDLVIMCGGRVGKDGIHGVTASSEIFSENTPAGHVQIGDPYTQKKMHDFLLEARDEGLIRFITDNGGGGLSSSVGETARFSNGCDIDLEKVPLKYDGLDQWEIWISESQERMTVAVRPDHLDRFMALSQKHAVESTVIGKYRNTGKLHIRYKNETCAYVDMDLLKSGFPQWEFEAEWIPPDRRGLFEPVLKPPKDFERLLLNMLSRPNIASKEWIVRQYDHEVQGTSVIKPLVGANRDVNSDASVIRPALESSKGLAYAQALIPNYSLIDTFHMTACTVDEAVRRLIAVGVKLENIGGIDNFCWPSIKYSPDENPDGKYKAAQLVRSCRALKDICLAYETPLLSGKDSMYVDGRLQGLYGETHKVSALPTLQFSAVGTVDDVEKCMTMDAKTPGDLVYVLGMTRNEAGASEYYDLMGYTGLNVPRVYPVEFMEIYHKLGAAAEKGLTASIHGVYRGGLGVHLALTAMAGELGMNLDLSKIPCRDVDRDDIILFSESPGRFIVTVNPDFVNDFENAFSGIPTGCIGTVTKSDTFAINGINGRELMKLSIKDLKSAWKKTFNELV